MQCSASPGIGSVRQRTHGHCPCPRRHIELTDEWRHLLAAVDPAFAAVDLAIGPLSGVVRLRALPGVFVAGEMLDWDAPTGGYLLQACFSTGHGAGEGGLGWLENAKP